jgi:hypothetical protein
MGAWLDEIGVREACVESCNSRRTAAAAAAAEAEAGIHCHDMHRLADRTTPQICRSFLADITSTYYLIMIMTINNYHAPSNPSCMPTEL